ncbi:MAG: histidine kinase, partial [Ferruginibacter sp.]
MKRSFDIKLLKFYVWVALAYATLYLLSNQHSFPGTFLQAVVNNLWRVPYLIVVNFIFLEYTVPFVLRKRRYIIYNILLTIPALWV